MQQTIKTLTISANIKYLALLLSATVSIANGCAAPPDRTAGPHDQLADKPFITCAVPRQSDEGHKGCGPE